jgi:hypothetical protein
LSLLLRHLEKPKTGDMCCPNPKGGIMPLNDARRFVAKMREDHNFRNKALEVTGAEDLTSLLHAEGMLFDQRELVGAMAECMAELEQKMER